MHLRFDACIVLLLAELSITDGLTKLHNDRYFPDHLTREIKRISRNQAPLSLILLDIDDDMKPIGITISLGVALFGGHRRELFSEADKTLSAGEDRRQKLRDHRQQREHGDSLARSARRRNRLATAACSRQTPAP